MSTMLLDNKTPVTVGANNGILASISNGEQSMVVFTFRLSPQQKTQSDIALRLSKIFKV